MAKRYQINLKERLEAAFPSARYTAGIFANSHLRGQGGSNNPYKGSSEIIVRDNSRAEQFSVASRLPMFDRIEVRSTTSNLVYKFDYDPLVDISYSKSITETKTSAGRMVVEYAGINPASISIRGVLWDPEGAYPGRELERLLEVFQEEAVLEVSSRLFNFHKIANIYIKSLATPALEGFEDTQPFTIQARSIEPVKLVITENELR